MRNKSLLVLLGVICIGLFIPKNTFAEEIKIYNNVYIDYRFFIDEDESKAGNLKFKLYDKSGTLNFTSAYDSETKNYYFEHDEIGFEENENSQYGDYLQPYDYQYSNFENQYRLYVPYREQLSSFNSTEVIFFKNFISDNKIHGGYGLYYGSKDRGPNFYFYTYVPMILEEIESHSKKIVFSSLSYNKIFPNHGDYGDFVQLFLVNNTNKIYENCMLEYVLDDINFIRKTTLDYSDELWEELNNGPIASSEIYTDNISSANYHYLNQSINSSTRNMAEETIEDYAASLPVLSFRKANDINNNSNGEANNILDIVTNPKTWNNGVVILIISLMIIIISSLSLIKKKKH